MAYATETLLDDFFGDLNLLEITFELSESAETKSTAGGDVVDAEYGVRYWFGTVTLGSNDLAEHERQMARIRAIQTTGRTFLVSPRHYDGSDRGLVNGRLAAVSQNRLVTFAGVGASRTYAQGTYFSFAVAGVNRLHQLAEGGVSNTSGSLGPIEVVPPLEPGYTADPATGTAVRFNTPYCRAKILKGTLRPAALRGRRGAGIQFDWRQQYGV